MKRGISTLSVLALALAIVWPVSAQNYAQDVVVSVPRLPRNVDEFIAMTGRLTGEGVDESLFQGRVRPGRGNAPRGAFGGAAAFVIAGVVFAQQPELGMQMLTIAMHPSERQPNNGPGSYNGYSLGGSDRQSLRERWLRGQEHITRSYILGTTPQNQYTLPNGPLRIRFARQARDTFEDGQVKLFVFSSGADRPRPLTVRSDPRGRFKAKYWSSLTVGIRPPVQAPDPNNDF